MLEIYEGGLVPVSGKGFLLRSMPDVHAHTPGKPVTLYSARGMGLLMYMTTHRQTLPLSRPLAITSR